MIIYDKKNDVILPLACSFNTMMFIHHSSYHISSFVILLTIILIMYYHYHYHYTTQINPLLHKLIHYYTNTNIRIFIQHYDAYTSFFLSYIIIYHYTYHHTCHISSFLFYYTPFIHYYTNTRASARLPPTSAHALRGQKYSQGKNICVFNTWASARLPRTSARALREKIIHKVKKLCFQYLGVGEVATNISTRRFPL